MLRTYVTHSELLKYEPRIDDYLASDQNDYTDIIASAKEILTQDLKSNKLELKKLCVPLVLHTGAETTSDTGVTKEDLIERRFLVLTISALSGTATFTFKGTNTQGGTPDNTIKTVVITETGEYTYIFDEVYKYYSLDYSGTTSCTYTAWLVEESFYLAHVYLSLNRIYQQNRHRINGNVWEVKAEYYNQLYETQMRNIVHSYDSDLDGDTDEGEMENIRVTFRR